MSQRQKHRSRRSTFPWLAIVFAGVLLVAAAVVWVERDPGEEEGTPVLVAEPEVIDYGDVRLDTPLSFSITITNAGTGTLRFTEEPVVQVLEGC